MHKSLMLLMLLALTGAPAALARPAGCVVKQGRLYVNGGWVFLKTAKPLIDYSKADEVDRLIKDLPILRAKNFNCIEINCYWHQFDPSGEATELPTAPLNKLISAIATAGMFPCLSVETYGVGGGQVPEGFWKKHPDAIAIDSNGKAVKDDEYGFGNAVPSLFSPEYLAASRAYIVNLARSIDFDKLLYFETTVEPQYMGNHALEYGAHARRAFEKWQSDNHVAGPKWPEKLPAPPQFVSDPIWNRFRAEYLADWINGDAAAYRSVAGADGYIAVDYLETCGKEMRNRNGDSLTFLRKLTSANIIQVNWHWHVAKRAANQCAYDHVKQVMRETGRDWAIAEHMTINGTDYSVKDMEPLLRNTIAQSTNFSWEFVSTTPDSGNTFALYNDDWSAKPLMKVVDENWARWMGEILGKAGR